MNGTIQARLMVMMFLEFFLWGCWYATMGTYLFKIGFSGLEVGAAFSTISWGAIISPFFVGMIADRFLSAEKVLAIIHIVGAFMLWHIATVTDPNTFFWTLLAYTILYMPTIALTNTISFNQMDKPEKDFPIIRVLGTIGWIVAGYFLDFLDFEDSNQQFQLAAGCSILLGIYSFTLPSTPPKAKGERPTVSDILGLDALSLLKDRNFSVFLLCSLLISIPLTFYYNFTNPFLNEIGVENAISKMTLGQWSEIIFMLLLPLFFIRLGVKKMLLLAMAAWVLRYILFAYGDNDTMVWMLYGGILLHGICYDFFFVTGQIYVDNTAPKEIQASAQGLITLITYGAGMLIGSLASGYFVDMYTRTDDTHLWETIWLIPAVMAVVCAIIFAIFFREEKKDGVLT